MKRDPRLKRNGERVLLGYGGGHRRPRYHPCPTVRVSIAARIARSMRLPLWVIGGTAPEQRIADARSLTMPEARDAINRAAW